MEITPATSMRFIKKDNYLNFQLDKEFSSDFLSGIFKKTTFNLNIIYPSESIITNRCFCGKIDNGSIYWKDIIKFNDSSSQMIQGEWGTYSIKITTGESSGWLNVYEGNRKRKIAGSLFSDKGELSINEIESFYLYKKFDYQWDSYYTPKTSPDEVSDLTIYSYFYGSGTITIFDGQLQKSSPIYTDFWKGEIK